MARALFYAFTWFILMLVAKVLFRVRVEGRENVPAKGPVLLVSNHCSMIDPPIVGICVFPPLRLSYLAKRELWNFKPLGWYLSGLGCIPVDRTADSDRKAIATCMRLLKESKALLVFPEGTRSPDGGLQPFKQGAARMALSNPGTLILPVRVEGTHQALPPGRSFPRPRKVIVKIGEPIDPAALDAAGGDRKSLYQAVTEAMVTRIKQL